MTEERKQMFKLSANIVRDRLASESALDVKIIDSLDKDTVQVVYGQADQIQDVLSAISIPHTVIQPELLHLTKLKPNQTLFVNCHTPGYNDSATKVVADCVNEGGQLITTDWALNTLVQKAFPGKLSYSGGNTVDSVVSMRMTSDESSYVMKGFKHEDSWKLAGGAHPINVDDKDKVKVLLFSEELASSQSRNGAILVTFDYGKGTVYHMVSHFALQQTIDVDRKNSKFDSANSYAQAKGATESTVNLIRTYEEQQKEINYENVQAATTCSEFVMRSLIQQHMKIPK
jgi:hypothetical protein